MIEDPNSINSMIGLFSGIIGIIALVVSISIFWYRMSVANGSILKSLAAIITRQEKTNEFEIIVSKDVRDIKEDHHEHQATMATHIALTNEIAQDLRSQREGQKYMTRLFEDLKALAIKSNEATEKLSLTMEKLATIIDLKMK